ncbi:hypothetical protein GCM10023195_53350 [Actinoallomurus liliacearum]|uniref:Uncharacterized protein n=1 Tax=Actinoallomurus liliacearum TaxID=1080073 RepID=A0ABP8TTG2_9ACTN
MRRIATLVATGAVAAAAAIALAAGPASADTKSMETVPLGSLQSAPAGGVHATATYHYWQIGGTKRSGYTRWSAPYDIAGVYTYGKYWNYKSKLALSVYGKDTKADGLAAGFEIKIPGEKYPLVITPKTGKKTFSDSGYVNAKYAYIREVLGHRNTKTKTFTVTKAGKYKKISI